MTDSLKAPQMKMNNSERLVAAIVSPLLAFVGFVAPCIGANADYCTVTNMCWNGAKTNILAIAESRLAANTNDIVGIVLKLEYDLSFSYLDDFTNNIPKAIKVASGVHTPNFAELYNDFVVSLTHLEKFIRENPASEADLVRERAKGNIPHKRMNFNRFLKALDDDGFFEGTPNEDE